MKNIFNKSLLLFCLFLASKELIAQNHLGKERVKHLKESVVRILIDGNSVGTGFFISEKGDILTNCHVIFNGALKIDSNKIKSKIQIVKNDSILIDVFIPYFFLNEIILLDAKLHDYFLLKISEPNQAGEISYLKMDTFDSIEEGDMVISCGYPHGIKQPFISSGLLSTKWNNINSFSLDGKQYEFNTDVAWLDLTLNPGNSGGPIIKLGDKYEDDRVIGIASFILNPYVQKTELLRNHALKSSKSIDMNYNGVNQLKVNADILDILSNNSIGVSGCISINHFLATYSLYQSQK